MLLLLAALAFAEPSDDPYDDLRDRVVLAAGADQIAGVPSTLAEDARRWDTSFAADAPPALADALAALEERLAPERAAAAGDAVWVVRPRAGLAIGTLVPTNQDGDAEAGLISPRVGADGRYYRGRFEARLAPTVGLDALPGVAPHGDVEARVGLRTEGFHLALSHESRWFGPGRYGALLYTNNGRPVPALEIGGDTKLPGRAAVAGRFSVRGMVGVIPWPRRDVVAPQWLGLDLRWQPIPWLELGATRNSVWGGFEDGAPRPVDPLQLLLPTEPHVGEDPERVLPDSDERASIDIRGTLPVHRLVGGPITAVSAWVQQGGEDVIARRLGPVPYPSLAGVANLYGGEVVAGPLYANVEHTVIEDDYFRWYYGHRIYHDGWTAYGRPMGHPSGGDSRTWTAGAGWVDPRGFGVEARFDHVRRVLVADLLEDTLFVFPGFETTDTGALRGTYFLGGGGSVVVSAAGGRVRDAEFVPGVDRNVWRIGLLWRAPQLTGRKGAPAVAEEDRISQGFQP